MPPSATNLHHDLARAARAIWLAERLGPGSPVSEASLAARLAVSRTPVRAALRLLEDAGVTERRGRARVLRDPGRDLPDLRPDTADALTLAIARGRASGQLPDHVTEAELMRRYDASRGLLARVLSHLAALGLVRREPAQGWRFTGDASAEDRAAAHRYRLAVEAAAVREPGYRLDRDFARTMRDAHAAVLARPFHPEDIMRFFEMNAAFHLGVARGGGNRFLVAAVEHGNGLRRLVNYAHRFEDGEAHRTCREHLAILDALEAGDAERAAPLLDAHIRRAGP